jgi:uncharacterized protein (TIGR04255 family)
MERKCRYVPLAKQPLVLVLGQVRFSPIRQMADYIPAIQEEFRRHGFPIERAGKVQQLIFGPGGGVPVQVVEQQRWEYRTKDETWSVLVTQDSVVLQTTAYEKFEGFAEKLMHAVHTVLSKTEHDHLGVVQRVGLRYVDVVQPRGGEDFRFYLRPGFHGVADEVFQTGTHRLHVESVGRTLVDGQNGTMVVRVVQNDQGFSLPPDLVGAAPKHASRAKAGEIITLVDMDHYIEGNFEPDAEWIVARAYEMHDHLIETFHGHVVTEDAVEVWK